MFKTKAHSVVYDPKSANFFPCGYVTNLSMGHQFFMFRFVTYPQGYWHQATRIRAIFSFGDFSLFHGLKLSMSMPFGKLNGLR